MNDSTSNHPIQPEHIEHARAAVHAQANIANADQLNAMMLAFSVGRDFTNGSLLQPQVSEPDETDLAAIEAEVLPGKVARKKRSDLGHRRSKNPHSEYSLARRILEPVRAPIGLSETEIENLLKTEGSVGDTFRARPVLTRSPAVFLKLANGNWILKKNALKGKDE